MRLFDRFTRWLIFWDGVMVFPYHAMSRFDPSRRRDAITLWGAAMRAMRAWHLTFTQELIRAAGRGLPSGRWEDMGATISRRLTL